MSQLIQKVLASYSDIVDGVELISAKRYKTKITKIFETQLIMKSTIADVQYQFRITKLSNGVLVVYVHDYDEKLSDTLGEPIFDLVGKCIFIESKASYDDAYFKAAQYTRYN